MKKRFYFVRHGESTANLAGMFQGETSVLTGKGVSQAKLLAERLKKLQIDCLITSDLPRAKHTAEIISQVINLPISSIDPILRERKNSSSFIGFLKTDSSILENQALIEKNINDNNWHFEDEENMFDLRQRTRKALKFLTTETSEKIVVVTHGWFLRSLILESCLDNGFSNKKMSELFYKMPITNTGIIIVDYELEEEKESWKLISWNDFSHLT